VRDAIAMRKFSLMSISESAPWMMPAERQKRKIMLVEKIVFESEWSLKDILKLIATKASQGQRTRVFLHSNEISMIAEYNDADTILSLDERTRISDLCCAVQNKIPQPQGKEREIFLYLGPAKTITVRFS
jgi:hypothetical protein